MLHRSGRTPPPACVRRLQVRFRTLAHANIGTLERTGPVVDRDRDRACPRATQSRDVNRGTQH